MKQKTILIDGVAFKYDPINLSYETNKPIDRQIAAEMLLKAKHIFEKRGIKYQLAFGTLLGVVRDKNIINGDEDVDIMTPNKEEFIKVIPAFADEGLKLCRVIENGLYSFMYKDGCYLDVYIVRNMKSLWGIYCYLVSGVYAVPKKLIRDSEVIHFLGESFSVPKDPTKILKFWYSETWNTPMRRNEGPEYMYGVRSYHYYRYVRHLIGNIVRLLFFRKQIDKEA